MKQFLNRCFRYKPLLAPASHELELLIKMKVTFYIIPKR
jgi:hypothetical protein